MSLFPRYSLLSLFPGLDVNNYINVSRTEVNLQYPLLAVVLKVQFDILRETHQLRPDFLFWFLRYRYYSMFPHIPLFFSVLLSYQYFGLLSTQFIVYRSNRIFCFPLPLFPRASRPCRFLPTASSFGKHEMPRDHST